ncbi:MAG: hypothetical protein IE909_06320 [Campylobacterales bacterium]|nr:hypothetical protein [Campylobacterales bacterium]
MDSLEHYIFVVKQHNLLILGDEKLHHFDSILKYFKNVYYLESTAHNFDSLGMSILELSITTLIITDIKNHQKIYSKLKSIVDAKQLNIILCITSNYDKTSEDLINLCDTAFTTKIEPKKLASKIFNSINEILATKAININFENPNHNQERYKDEFDLEVIYLSEELQDIAYLIDSGDIGKDVMLRFRSAVINVAAITKKFLITSKKIENLIYDLEDFLKNYHFELIDLNAIEGFEHLARLAEDIAVFLDKYFIIKEIKDLYMVEDSLTNSFEYIKLVFSGEQNSTNDSDGSSLEFF